MSGPFKLKYKDSDFPFKSPLKNDKKKTSTEQEEINKRAKQINEAIKLGDAPPISKETLPMWKQAIFQSKEV